MRQLALSLVLVLLAASAHAAAFETDAAQVMSELRPALQKAKPTPPPALPKNTPKQQVRQFADGWRVATHALASKPCEKLFMSKGAPEGAALAAMLKTEYRFLDLNNEGVGAQTNGPDSVFINLKGLYVTAENGKITLDGRKYELTGGEDGVRGMILLHELGHEMGLFGADAGRELRAENARHSLDVLHACIPSRPVF